MRLRKKYLEPDAPTNTDGALLARIDELSRQLTERIADVERLTTALGDKPAAVPYTFDIKRDFYGYINSVTATPKG